jgi:hypothetical protein
MSAVEPDRVVMFGFAPHRISGQDTQTRGERERQRDRETERQKEDRDRQRQRDRERERERREKEGKERPFLSLFADTRHHTLCIFSYLTCLQYVFTNCDGLF